MSLLRQAFGRVSRNRAGIVIRNMTIDGTITGESTAALDGSATAIDLWVEPDPGIIFELAQLNIEVSDAGNTGIDDYGGVNGPLTNGVQFFMEIKGARSLFGDSITSNRELVNLGPIVTEISFSNNVKIRTFAFNVLSHSTKGIILDGDYNDKLGISIQDDLSTLVAHSVVVKGQMIIKSI